MSVSPILQSPYLVVNEVKDERDPLDVVLALARADECRRYAKRCYRRMRAMGLPVEWGDVRAAYRRAWAIEVLPVGEVAQ